ncbi:BRO-N domain-containing protein [Thiomonas delicata]|uniref:Putative Prophage antirepressor n=1 Tax=Thiomonas delicata TaxID=364030 RepID=A0A238DAC1_THIDL|nr:BRO family protein [Thiomonas delicata]SBP90064.1 putative Prophage antirepressor [Thiomonas delicata]
MATAAETKPIIRLDFEGNPILVQMGDDGSVWYAAKPLCTALGFTKMTAALERHVKPGDQQPRGVPTGSGVQQMMHVNEAGMQALASASRLVAARRFRKWIVAGVIHAAVRAMEAQDGEVLGDRLQGMTEFKPVEPERQASCPAPRGQEAQVQAAAEQQGQAMSTEVMEFSFGDKTFKATLGLDGQSWFVASEACEILGFGNPRQAVSTHVEEEDRGVHSMDTLGGKQKVTVVNESGLYALIVGSRKPDAKKFKKWVTSEVLPTIRRTGRYSVEKPASPALGPIQAPGTQEKLQGAMDVARALIGVGEATLGREGLKVQIPHLSHQEVALGLAGLILKNKRFLLTVDDIEHPVIRPLEKNEMIIQASGSEWIDKLLSVMSQDQLKAMARLAMARIV